MTADSGGGNSLNYASYVIPCRNNNRKQSIEKHFPFITDDAQKVLDRGKQGCKFTLYKGTPIFYFKPINGVLESSFTPGPFILLSNVDLEINVIKHEYGHSRQFRILGSRYYTKIAVPSVVGYFIAKKSPKYAKYYYSQPSERSADLLGHVNWGENETYLKGSDTMSIIYLLLP